MDNRKPIEVAVVPVDADAYRKTINPHLKAFQDLVGGFIQFVPFAGGVNICCNEEGLIQGLPLCRILPDGNRIHGQFVLFQAGDNGEAESVEEPEELIELFEKNGPYAA